MVSHWKISLVRTFRIQAGFFGPIIPFQSHMYLSAILSNRKFCFLYDLPLGKFYRRHHAESRLETMQQRYRDPDLYFLQIRPTGNRTFFGTIFIGYFFRRSQHPNTMGISPNKTTVRESFSFSVCVASSTSKDDQEIKRIAFVAFVAFADMMPEIPS